MDQIFILTCIPAYCPSGTSALGCTDYPLDAFSASQCRGGAILLHFLGLFYTFLGLSIICDEFFVPALEEMTFSRLHMTPDVAGATPVYDNMPNCCKLFIMLLCC